MSPPCVPQGGEQCLWPQHPSRGLWHPLPRQAETIRSGSKQGQTPPTLPREQSHPWLKTEPPGKQQRTGAGGTEAPPRAGPSSRGQGQEARRLHPEQGPSSNARHRVLPRRPPSPSLSFLICETGHRRGQPSRVQRTVAEAGHTSAPAASAFIHSRAHAASPRVGPQAS